MTHTLGQRIAAEFIGTFWLVFGGCGAAVLGGNYLGVAFAFGLTVLTMAYALGHISGGHFNPAVTIGLAQAKRFAWKDVPAYVVTQVVAAITAALVLFVVAKGKDGFVAKDGFATNGFGDHSPDGYNLLAVIIVEVVLTAVFLYIILGTTDTRAPKGFAPIAIGLGLTLIHLISIPVSNTSVNPARSIGPALFAGGDVILQQWVFILAPAIGALIAGATYKLMLGSGDDVAPLEEATQA